MKMYARRKTILVSIVVIVTSVSVAMAKPLTPYSAELSPPLIESPIYKGAEIVGVEGFIPGAQITIYANDTEEIGKGSFWFGKWMFEVDRKLEVGDKITATQTVQGKTSYPTKKPVVVEKLPADVLSREALSPPSIVPPLYNCQKAVIVEDILKGAEVSVLSDGTLVGKEETPYNCAHIRTHQLDEKDSIKASQIICGEFPSELSSEEIVQSTPTSLPKPVVDEDCLVNGDNTVVVHGLITGAFVNIYSDGKWIGGGIAPGPNVIFLVNTLLETGKGITAEQSLCQVKSESSVKTVKDSLDPPLIEKPICAGSDSITVCDTAFNAILTLYVNGKQVGQRGATGNCNTLYSGNNILLKDGDEVIVTQTKGTVTSSSDPEKVTALSDPIIKIGNGHYFFESEGNEQAIPGPVFLRGVLTTNTYGPVFKVVMCGAEKVVVEIIDPHGETIENIPLVKTRIGCFEGGWDWKHTGWNIPGDIPVGEYSARFSITGSAGTTVKEQIFYVIFDPAEVTASSAFSLSERGEKGIWFSNGYGCDFARTYALHPDDNRIFCLAIKGKDCLTLPSNIKARVKTLGINGETNQFTAAQTLLTLETSLFGYITKGGDKTYDVINMLEKEQDAQCFQDANMFVALLRSVGIPAYPVVADAAKEHENVWNFDTWTEVRLNGPLPPGEQWYVFHPHYEPGWGPDNRSTAGHLWYLDVACKEKNDIIIAAGANWDKNDVDDKFADVVFSYDTDCKEPNQNFDHQAKWLNHLCEAGYWNPEAHWTCSPPWQPLITISLDKERYQVGDTVLVNVNVDNPTEDTITAELAVDIVVYHPCDMAGEEILNEFREIITIAPRSSESIEISHKIPLALSDANNYFVRATFAEAYATTPFTISSLFEWELVLPDHVEDGEEFMAELIIANPQESTLIDIHVNLALPFEVRTFEETLEKHIEKLEPHAEKTLTWHLGAISHTIVAPFEFTVTSENGGGTRILKGVEILPIYTGESVTPYILSGLGVEFELHNLSVPARVRTGEIIIIKIDIANMGKAVGTMIVNLKINDTVIDFKEVILDAGEKETVEFIHVAEDEPGIYSVEVDGKTGEYMVTSGFEVVLVVVVFAVVGLLVVAYLLRKRK